MPRNPRAEVRDSPEPCDSIAKIFGLPAGPPRPSQLRVALSWLWRFFVDGFAACGLAMYPCLEDPSDFFASLCPTRRESAQHATTAQVRRSPWQFEDLARGAAPEIGSDDTMLAGNELGTRKKATRKSGAR